MNACDTLPTSSLSPSSLSSSSSPCSYRAPPCRYIHPPSPVPRAPRRRHRPPPPPCAAALIKGVRKDSLRPLASEVSTSRDSGCPADEPLISTCTSPAHYGAQGPAGPAGPARRASYPFHLVLRLRVLQVSSSTD
ncbi:5-hydroxytryptamine receptor 3A [Frankliniella fusca]|uniref:5-hydroxytryptamine receptor 3A n=1 Tax=Frankliniella fusca TaxID=407009 RepID=A0AAE1GUD3_9NEOP|nr:5-hydroxytryptamine receptor 3A [Frankliniella fusca]